MNAPHAVSRTRTLHGVQVPTFFYGTAWKDERTSPLVAKALAAGFSGVDTANQRKHYYEAGVGQALAEWFGRGEIQREAVFLQTKFTFIDGQDHRLPYDPRAPVAEQVAQSFDSSLEHLGVDFIDSYVLHGPSVAVGLAAADEEAWRAMERLHDGGRARLLGVSNVTVEQIEALVRLARVPPAFVQNRCYAARGWDAAVREACARHGIVYQGFSLLTANRAALGRADVRAIADRLGRTVPQVVFRFALQLGMIPLTGTTDPKHMAEDLAAYEFELTEHDMRVLGA